MFERNNIKFFIKKAKAAFESSRARDGGNVLFEDFIYIGQKTKFDPICDDKFLLCCRAPLRVTDSGDEPTQMALVFS